MNYFTQILSEYYYLVDATVHFCLSDSAAFDAAAAEQARAPWIARAHRWSSTALRASAVCNIIHASYPSSHTFQEIQALKPILLLPVGLFETAIALYKGEKLEALTYFNFTVLPGVVSLAEAYHQASLLSSNDVSVYRTGGNTATYLLPGDRNYTGF